MVKQNEGRGARVKIDIEIATKEEGCNKEKREQEQGHERGTGDEKQKDGKAQ